MSLVAYEASSESESDEDEDTPPIEHKSLKTDDISDEDEDYTAENVDLQDLKKPAAFTLSLPKPKNVAAAKEHFDNELNQNLTLKFANLPMPKSATNWSSGTVIEAADDEFLRKKALPKEVEKPQSNPTKATVKITIPSLSEFGDVDKEKANKAKSRIAIDKKPKGSGLLSILPTAKSEQNFAKIQNLQSAVPNPKKISFIPDTVKNRRPAHNTEGVDGLDVIKKKPQALAKKPKPLPSTCNSDSDDETETTAGDFFSLNRADVLPEVSANEINAMVAKRAAKMTEATSKYLETATALKSAPNEAESLAHDAEMQHAQKRYHDQQLDADAMQALVGSSAKRRRNQQPDIQVMDISSAEVLPDREEWMRTALASSTSYQPTGVLVDEEPASGTRRKHQITYLAHKAKANEAELQAMWAANRQNRRATQSKYGF